MNVDELSEQELYQSLTTTGSAPQYSCTKQTRSRSVGFKETGATTGCYSMQQYIMIRIALYSLFPYLFDAENQLKFLKNERIIYICLTNNWQLIGNDKQEFPKDIKKTDTIESYITRKSENPVVLIQNIHSIKEITNSKSIVDMYYNFNEKLKNPDPNFNSSYNLKSLKNFDVETPKYNKEYITVCRPYIEEYIGNSYKYPIPMAFGYKFQIKSNSNLDQLAIDHWFVFWKGRIHTAWGDDMFGFKYFRSPLISAEYFCELLLFLKNMELPHSKPSVSAGGGGGNSYKQSAFNFNDFMQNYMGINVTTVTIYPTYKDYYKQKQSETSNTYITRLKKQVVDNLINSYLAPHDLVEYNADNSTYTLEHQSKSRFNTASNHGFGGFDIYEVKPFQTEYYTVLLEIIPELARANIIDLTVIERMSRHTSRRKTSQTVNINDIQFSDDIQENSLLQPTREAEMNRDAVAVNVNPENMFYKCLKNTCKLIGIRGMGKYKTTRNKKFIENRKVRQNTHKKRKYTARKIK